MESEQVFVLFGSQVAYVVLAVIGMLLVQSVTDDFPQYTAEAVANLLVMQGKDICMGPSNILDYDFQVRWLLVPVTVFAQMFRRMY